MTNWLDSKQHARQAERILHTAWWEAYRVAGEESRKPLLLQDPDRVASVRIMRSALDKLKSEAIEKFGVKSECALCREYSVFGGPGHEASRLCRSGKRPHCTCDACF